MNYGNEICKIFVTNDMILSKIIFCSFYLKQFYVIQLCFFNLVPEISFVSALRIRQKQSHMQNIQEKVNYF